MPSSSEKWGKKQDRTRLITSIGSQDVNNPVLLHLIQYHVEKMHLMLGINQSPLCNSSNDVTWTFRSGNRIQQLGCRNSNTIKENTAVFNIHTDKKNKAQKQHSIFLFKRPIPRP